MAHKKTQREGNEHRRPETARKASERKHRMVQKVGVGERRPEGKGRRDGVGEEFRPQRATSRQPKQKEKERRGPEAKNEFQHAPASFFKRSSAVSYGQ